LVRDWREVVGLALQARRDPSLASLAQDDKESMESFGRWRCLQARQDRRSLSGLEGQRRICVTKERLEAHMTAEKKSSNIEEKIDRLEDNVHEVLAGTKESLARAEESMEKAKEVLGEGVGKVKTRSAEAYEKAKDYLADARSALDTAREKMGELYGRARELAEEMYEKVKSQYDRLAAEVKKAYAKIKAKVQEIDVKEMRDDAVDYIRRNPGKSILIALAVGFAVGYMVRRREV
jgi:ElaB/YqjD/DUF883 family membrane-anchored ribosome-binding protein